MQPVTAAGTFHAVTHQPDTLEIPGSQTPADDIDVLMPVLNVSGKSVSK